METVGARIQRVWSKFTPAGDCPVWPPDVFAICATLLRDTGLYVEIVRDWPPVPDWIERVEEAARAWRDSGGRTPPPFVVDAWQVLSQAAAMPIEQVNRPVLVALATLLAVADETCVGVGIPTGQGTKGPFLFSAEFHLILGNQNRSLCREIPVSVARVLPKQHTPKSGMTLRNLSHHLALCPGLSVDARWFSLPSEFASTPPRPQRANVLLVPWPHDVQIDQFSAVEPPQGQLLNMPPPYGFFTYERKSEPLVVRDAVVECFENAVKLVSRVDMVVLPELALSEEEHKALHAEVVVKRRATLIAGVRSSANGVTPGKNYCRIDVPPRANVPRLASQPLVQQKHHRWCLDRSQVRQYGLQGILSPEWRWWEHIELASRAINFVAYGDWLAMAALICEDLARQDPISDVIRSVGPNLVIALLMDAPQLKHRWPARYATVLSEDPGCSVLTFSSAGMVDGAKPPEGVKHRRVVALWSDARSGTTELELPDAKKGLILTLIPHWDEEFSADGRSDGGAGSYPELVGWHAV